MGETGQEGGYPGARAPDRVRIVDSDGVAISVKEWGDDAAPPLFLAHGGMDFARTFDVFAPLLADGGWRVVSWDHRGHGDSQHAALYSWEVDLRDAVHVLDSVTSDAAPIVGHSKGGSLMLQLADALPHRVSSLVNIDGLPSRRGFPDVSDHQRTKLLAQELSSWLDHRRQLVTAQRKPGTIDELAERRARMNPRLPLAWLRHLVTVGAREDEDGWRWKIDPTMRFGGFGPWRPEWSMMRLPDIGVPILAVLGTEADPLGWGTLPEDVLSHLPPTGRLTVLDGVGHFIHIERPHEVAELVLEHLSSLAAPVGRGRRPSAGGEDLGLRSSGSGHDPGLRRSAGLDSGVGTARAAAPTGPVGRGRRPSAGGHDPGLRSSGSGHDPGLRRSAAVRLRHNKVELALHELRGGTGRPLLHLHGLGERSPEAVPDHLAGWPGPVAALDLTGHGESDVAVGAGYFCEVLMGDVDLALAHLGPVTIFGRGLGAYIGLLTSGGRPELVRGAILFDGPGLAGGGPSPMSPAIPTVAGPAPPGGTPDPWALVELTRDVRPPDYAASFARQAAARSGLDTAIAVTGVNRPPWLEAVADEPGVVTCSLAEALELLASVD